MSDSLCSLKSVKDTVRQLQAWLQNMLFYEMMLESIVIIRAERWCLHDCSA